MYPAWFRRYMPLMDTNHNDHNYIVLIIMYRIRGIFHETIISTLKILHDFNLTKSALK